MAKATSSARVGSSNDKRTAPDGSMTKFIVALGVLTAFGGGVGYGFAAKILSRPSDEVSSTQVGEVSENSKRKSDVHDESPIVQPKISGKLVPIPPIVTNLLEPSQTFIRIEGAILVDEDYADGANLAAKVSEDVIVLLKTLTLSRLQGSSGLNHLREDINDRVKIRSEKKAKELIINALVIE